GGGGVTLWRIKQADRGKRPDSKPLELTEVYRATLSAATVFFSPDSKRLACSLYDGTLHLWDVENSRPRLSPPARLLGPPILNGAFFPDGNHVQVYGGTAEVWDARTGQK